MKVDHIDRMIRGWFVGDFEPSLYRTRDVEVGMKTYPAGTTEGWHHHKIATEITVIVSGRVRMNGREYGTGDIVVIEPGEGTDFEALTDVTNVVVKLPGAVEDKYETRDPGVVDALPLEG